AAPFHYTTVTIFFPFFSFNATSTTQFYTLSLHDALPISEFKAKCFAILDKVEGTGEPVTILKRGRPVARLLPPVPAEAAGRLARSEEHTSELQSRSDLVCRLLLEKKNNKRGGRAITSDNH